MHHNSLALGVPRVGPGSVVALAVSGRISAEPLEGKTIRFGRNLPQVDICVGGNDIQVSRQHGLLTHHAGQWWVRNIGRLPIRMPPTRLLFTDEDPLPLPDGYTPLFVRGTRDREHVLEVYVAGADGAVPTLLHGAETAPRKRWRLTDDERLLLVTLGQRYLLHEPNPQPVGRHQVAEVMAELRPDDDWTVRKVERVIAEVRQRLSSGGEKGLTREEVGEPVGNSLNHNLVTKLMSSTSLVPTDLALLDALF
ncbi:FHA domain-containing protein [Lentzea sp. NBRC 105346]|uniref:FHA domain-containing protein n=1 Tax=Lentzea sp. NBRC 105346 TaxID=3032205 RepID=UPI002555E0AE|nr:FHA domain-containing protein [Lentzea sp. NBRC 105346]